MRFFLTLIALTLLVTPALADHHEGAQASDMAAMGPMGKPAEMDKIAFLQGEWKVDMKFKMDPTADWTASSATAKTEPVLGGCVNRMSYTGDMMGMPFHGVDHTTFNRETGQYESVWIDDMSAKMSFLSGNFEGDKLVMTGTDIWQGQEYHTKSVATKVSDDEVQWSMYMSMDGGETWFENMKMHFTRVK